MATPSAARPGRTIAVLAVLTALIYGAIFFAAPDSIGKHTLTLAEKYKPRLGLDLEGGTSVILTPRLTKGSGKVTEGLAEPGGLHHPEPGRQLRRRRVRGHHGRQQHRHLDPGQAGQEHPRHRAADRRAALPPGAGQRRRRRPRRSRPPRRHRRASGTATPSTSTERHGLAVADHEHQQRRVPEGPAQGGQRRPTPSPTPHRVGQRPDADRHAAPLPRPPRRRSPPPLQQKFLSLDCGDLEKVRSAAAHAGRRRSRRSRWSPAARTASEKYILGPAEVLGTDVKSAQRRLATNNQGSPPAAGWSTSTSTAAARRSSPTSTRGWSPDDRQRPEPVRHRAGRPRRVAPRAPTARSPTATPQITGNFTQDEATSLANVSKYGALPLTFDAGEVQEISATLGSDQLQAGLIAGAIGLLLVVLYSLLYYRGLGFVTVASLCVSAILTYGLVVLLGWQLGFRLSLAGVAGLIVAIGITADSFIVYFERLRDEVREGKTLRVAVESGWVRARRTILAADFVSFLAAVILYILSAAACEGFAFTLGLTTLIDIVVVFVFTKPMLTMLARTKFFGQGHRWSGLDPDRLGSTRRTLLTPAPRGRGGCARPPPATEA